ncbi:MAG: thiolase family protein [Flavobacteriaceae bacterium]|nr:thiolase family protein [Flavobacteriaceae bacterium]MDA8900355.1 thiolase family protein [Flavobacteriaceae bacterium]MDA8993041.1 thiolase family protein [Flavobacteriaceae bacterium]
MEKKIVVVAAKRTPIGSFMGGLSAVPATRLGSIAIAAVLEAASVKADQVDEVFMGHVLQAGTGQAPARQAALGAGIPDTVPCTTVNKVCASGMKAISLAIQAIRLGDADIVVAGGMENMSLSPHLSTLRTPTKFGSTQFQDSMQLDGLTDAYDQVAMGVFADACAAEYNFSRADQDAYAIQSYQRSAAAWEAGAFDAEIVPVAVPQRKGPPQNITQDEEFKNVFIDKIPQLRPAFSKEGTVTAANASTINDGAAALLLMSSEKAEALGIKPLAKVCSYADAAQEPRWFTTAPAKALPKALAKAGLQISDIDLFELNEAFAVVGLANTALLNLDSEKVNPNGGAVALGHPIGCSGARISVTLLHALHQRQKKYGAAGICNGGGGATAIIFENLI